MVTNLEKTLEMRTQWVLMEFKKLAEEYRNGWHHKRTQRYYEHFADRIEKEIMRINEELPRINYLDLDL
jgi:hypothetical protein